ncbi:MAG: acyl-CoA thioesterase, partial [Myxococcaceae bacterium]|nr:acyl-CoA thioesterase [Myxococcaceae bacterium]
MSHWDEVTAHVEHRVTFSETDGLGFAHHRCVVVWFEQAREAFFRRFGVPAVELYQKGWLPAVRQLNVRYDSFLAYEDRLSIRVALTKLGRVVCDFHYRRTSRTKLKTGRASRGRRGPAGCGEGFSGLRTGRPKAELP